MTLYGQRHRIFYTPPTPPRLTEMWWLGCAVAKEVRVSSDHYGAGRLGGLEV